MTARLRFAEPDGATDALTFAGRAATLPEGTVRLVAGGGILTLMAPALAPRRLGEDTPVVLGMRTVAVDPELVCDLVVDASGLGGDLLDETAVILPDTALRPPWAGVAPPRSGWSASGSLAASTVAALAQVGIAEVTEQLPADAGEDIVAAVRAAVWSPPRHDLAELPGGVAFAAFALGFIAGAEQAGLFESGPWRRLSFHRGHILTRGPIGSGMTPVRRTGA